MPVIDLDFGFGFPTSLFISIVEMSAFLHFYLIKRD
jgi:hypothetical protein